MKALRQGTMSQIRGTKQRMSTPTSTELREEIVQVLTQLGEASANGIAVWLSKADATRLYDRGRIQQALEEDGHLFVPSVGRFWGLGPMRWRLRSAGAATADRVPYRMAGRARR